MSRRRYHCRYCYDIEPLAEESDRVAGGEDQFIMLGFFTNEFFEIRCGDLCFLHCIMKVLVLVAESNGFSDLYLREQGKEV